MGALRPRRLRRIADAHLRTLRLAIRWGAAGCCGTIPYTDPELLHPEDLIWPVGVNNFRVQYTAGYSTIPEAVQEANRVLGGG